MKICPVCGFDPDPEIMKPSDKELKQKQLEAQLMKNALQSYWLSQPYTICKWLRDRHGLDPEAILDAGCGDGRWVPAITKIWPNAHYTGIDRMEDHILNNRENMPDIEWFCSDIRNQDFHRRYNTVLIGGTLNPKIADEEQEQLFAKILQLAPKHIICLFDLKQTGTKPDFYLSKDYYNKKSTFLVPKDEQGVRQDLVVWLYERS